MFIFSLKFSFDEFCTIKDSRSDRKGIFLNGKI